MGRKSSEHGRGRRKVDVRGPSGRQQDVKGRREGERAWGQRKRHGARCAPHDRFGRPEEAAGSNDGCGGHDINFFRGRYGLDLNFFGVQGGDAQRRIEGGLEDQCLDQQGSASNELLGVRNGEKRRRGRTEDKENGDW